MKKISLKSVKEYLSRDEMRTISGGSGIYGCRECTVNSDCGSTVCANNQPTCPPGKFCLK